MRYAQKILVQSTGLMEPPSKVQVVEMAWRSDKRTPSRVPFGVKGALSCLESRVDSVIALTSGLADICAWSDTLNVAH